MNFRELFPLQVVINLDKRLDRLKVCMEEEFPKIGITPIRKPGVIPEGIDNSYARGAVGCLLSHYQILQSAINFDANVAIFEDDIQFLDNAKENLDLACEEISGMDWDMLYGSANILKPFHRVTNHLGKLFHAQSTSFYMINKNFAKKLLTYIDLGNINKEIDRIYAEDVIPNHNAFVTIPMIAIQRDDFSDILQEKANYSSYLEKRYWENLK